MWVFEGKVSACEDLPLRQRGRASFAAGLAVSEMAFETEVVVNVGMDRGELSQGMHSPEPQHRTLPS